MYDMAHQQKLHHRFAMMNHLPYRLNSERFSKVFSQMMTLFATESTQNGKKKFDFLFFEATYFIPRHITSSQSLFSF
jgi:hypothetical protein